MKMFARFHRFFSSYSKTSKHTFVLEPLKYPNPTPVHIANIVRQFYVIYNDARVSDHKVLWTSEPKVIETLNSLIPHLNKVEAIIINHLIVNMSFLTIQAHPIWSHLEQQFLEKGQYKVDLNEIPYIITGFSNGKSKNPELWKVLDRKMMEYYKEKGLRFLTAGLTLKALLTVGFGSSELKNLLKNFLIEHISELRTPLLTSLSTSILDKREEAEFAHLLFAKFLTMLDEASIDDLSKMLTNMFVMKVDYVLIQAVENQILKKIDSLDLKQIANCIGTYLSTSVKREDFSEFPQHLFTFYMNNRKKLGNNVRSFETLMALDCKIIGAFMFLNYSVDKTFIQEAYGRLKRVENILINHPNMTRHYLIIQNYVKSNNLE